jgi:CRISPR/Cas system-associated exonuclease Cas4 (RecB family)
VRHVVTTWFMMATMLSELAAEKLTCSHGSSVFVCSTCTQLLPVSFWNRLAWKRFKPVKNTIHVTSLTTCLRKAYLDAVTPSEDTVESAWAKLRGSLLHYAGRALGWSEMGVKMTLEIDREEVVIIGFVDAYDPDTATVYDLKTTRFVKWQAEKGFVPRENHIAQIQCYYTMLENYGVPVARLVLVYVDDKDIMPIQVPLGSRKNWMTRRATELQSALISHTEPNPETGSRCKYCPYANGCPRHQATMFKESMD